MALCSIITTVVGYGNTQVEDQNAFDESNHARIELVLNFLSALKVYRYSIYSILQFYLFSAVFTLKFYYQ